MDLNYDPCLLRRFLCTSHTFNDDIKDLVGNLVSNGRGSFVINVIGEFATNFVLAKSDVLLGALAFCATLEGGALRHSVYSLVPKICRIPRDLFKFLTFEAEFAVNRKGSFGRSKRRLVGQWYNWEVKGAKQLAVLMTKYKKRSGWSHADVLRLAHVRPVNDVRGLLFKYALKGFNECKRDFRLDAFDETLREEAESIMVYLEAVETVRHSRSEEEVAHLVQKHSLLREHVPTWMQSSSVVWRALVEKMPLLALIRNLNRLTTVGLLKPSDPSNCVELVRSRLEDADYLKEAKIHPFTVLIAWKTYESGHGERGNLRWNANREIVGGLKNAFNLSFQAILPTNKRYLLAIDCCQSMDIGGVMDVPSVTPLLASAAMAMAFSNNEPSSQIIVLSSNVQPLKIPPTITLEGLHNQLSQLCRGSNVVDCSSPMVWAKDNLEKPVDVFVIYTCQDGRGKSKTPIQALREYREKFKHPHARLVIVTLTSSVKCQGPNNDFDMGTLYLSGFDASVHEIIQSFVLGQLDAPSGG